MTVTDITRRLAASWCDDHLNLAPAECDHCLRIHTARVKLYRELKNGPEVLELGDSPCGCDAEPRWYTLASDRFLTDHAERGLMRHGDARIERLKSTVKVLLRPCDAAELLSDADHYADSRPSDWCMDDALGLISAARSVALRLRRAGVRLDDERET